MMGETSPQHGDGLPDGEYATNQECDGDRLRDAVDQGHPFLPYGIGKLAGGAGFNATHRNAPLSRRPRTSVTYSPNFGAVIISSVRGRGRSTGMALTRRPGRGDIT